MNEIGADNVEISTCGYVISGQFPVVWVLTLSEWLVASGFCAPILTHDMWKLSEVRRLFGVGEKSRIEVVGPAKCVRYCPEYHQPTSRQAWNQHPLSRPRRRRAPMRIPPIIRRPTTQRTMTIRAARFQQMLYLRREDVDLILYLTVNGCDSVDRVIGVSGPGPPRPRPSAMSSESSTSANPR